ncbi:MAG: NAD-dependent epimerase/dehydratase [Candidatus Omnitrophica bacterium]|nr:NAD-dependent epimerase/dehydratase [Candidatus Omnitrophota bacterium]
MGQEKQHILITGVRGFVGRNLVEFLTRDYSDKYNLFAPTHAELELLDHVQVEDFVSKNQIDCVIHCANVGGSRKTAYDIEQSEVITKNLRMFFNLVKALPEDKRIITCGSGAEYDYRHYIPKMKERYFGSYIPNDQYGFSKYICAKYIEKRQNAVNLRIFGVFGRYEDYTYRFISNAIVKNLLKLPIVINQNIEFDFIYVDDLVKGIVFFIDYENKYKSYNLTTGNKIDLVSIVNKINAIADNKSKITVKNPGLNTEYSADNTRFLKEYPDFRLTAFDAALKQLYDWYKDNINDIDVIAVKADKYIKYCKTKK